MVAHTGLEPVISALRGQRVNQLHQCAVPTMDYRFAIANRQVCSSLGPSGPKTPLCYTALRLLSLQFLYAIRSESMPNRLVGLNEIRNLILKHFLFDSPG